MKKTYVKPQIMFESFALSTAIAGTCDVKTWTPNSGSCAYEFEDEFGVEYYVFTDSISACKDKEPSGEYNEICYDIPTSGINLFNS